MLLLVFSIRAEVKDDAVASDFTNAFLPAAEDVLAGRSPYAETGVLDYVYTPVFAWLATPFTLLPLEIAQALVSALLLLTLPTSIWLLSVRDWRVYGIVLLWAPVLQGFQSANVTFLLCLLAALAWRHRDDPWLPGVWVGISLALKPILWPLGVWLVCTSRWRSLGLAAGLAVVSFLLVVPYESPVAFVQLVQDHAGIRDRNSYTLFALLADLGVPETVARAVWLGVGAVCLFLARRSFSGCVICALLLSPLVWLHYLALLVVPMAIGAAPLWVWALPLVGWLGSGPAAEPGIGREALMVGVIVLVVWLTIRSAGERSRTGTRRLR